MTRRAGSRARSTAGRGRTSRAAAYLPPGTSLRALLLLLIKPRPNSFVFDVGTDSAAIFRYLDPAVTQAQLEVTLAHELHHIGYRCMR